MGRANIATSVYRSDSLGQAMNTELTIKLKHKGMAAIHTTFEGWAGFALLHNLLLKGPCLDHTMHCRYAWVIVLDNGSISCSDAGSCFNFLSLSFLLECLAESQYENHLMLNFVGTYISSRKYTPPFAHNFEAKVGRGHLLEHSIHLVHMPPPFLTLFAN